nr:hypothetical protein [Tanacetum cinerariifolium]
MVSLITANRQDLCLIALAFFTSAGKVPSARYLKRGVIQVSPSSSTTNNISISPMDFSFSYSTSTCLLNCAKRVEAILLRESAFLFSLLRICLIENAFKSPEDLSVKKIHGSGRSPSSSIEVSKESSSGLSTTKSANIYPLTNTLDHPCTLPDFCQSAYGTLYPLDVENISPACLDDVSDVSQDAGHICRLPSEKSKLRWSSPHNLFRPPSVRVEPIITVCSIYSGFIATLTLSSIIGLAADGVSPSPETIAHSSGTNLLLFRVITHPSTSIFSIS